MLILVVSGAINPRETSKGLSSFMDTMFLMLLEVNLVFSASQSVGLFPEWSWYVLFEWTFLSLH